MRRRSSIVAALALALALAACATSRPSGTSPDPAVASALVAPGCAGTDLDLDALGDACRFPGSAATPPPPEAIEMTVEPATLTVASGAEGRASLRIRNRTDRAQVLELHDGCLAFEAQIFGADGKARADLSEDCVLGGLCAQSKPQRVELPPGGSVRKAFDVRAMRTVTDADCHGTEQKLPAGRYVLRVISPFQDRDPVQSHVVHSRTVDGALVVTN